MTIFTNNSYIKVVADEARLLLLLCNADVTVNVRNRAMCTMPNIFGAYQHYDTVF